MKDKTRKKIAPLTPEEALLEESFDLPSIWKQLPATDVLEAQKFAALSREARRKEARVNIRMSEHDVSLLKLKAEQEGLGYQTLMSSIIHKYVTEQLVEKKYVDELAAKLKRLLDSHHKQKAA